MLWNHDWCIYDIPNENVMYCDPETELSDEELSENKIKMPVAQATQIRRAKNLPMPCPPVEVVYAGKPE